VRVLQRAVVDNRGRSRRGAASERIRATRKWTSRIRYRRASGGEGRHRGLIIGSSSVDECSR